MASYRLIKRGILFGADDDLATRKDFASEDLIASNVQGAGSPIPVVFGTRFIHPTVVGWRGLLSNIKQYMLIRNTRSVPATTDIPSTIPPGANTNITVADNDTVVIMYILSMRMILCVGGIDSVTYWEAGGVQFNAHQTDLPDSHNSLTSGDSPAFSYNTVFGWFTDRYTVAVQDYRLFGDTSGLGYSAGRQNYTVRSNFSEFWLSKGETINTLASTDRVIDEGTVALGVSSLVFNNFNFGGRSPLPPWRLAVTRVDNLTRRHPVTNRYLPNWLQSYARLTVLTRPVRRKVYLWILDRTLRTVEKRAVNRYLLSLPYDSTTTYQLVESATRVVIQPSPGNETRTRRTIHPRTTDRSTVLRLLNNWATARPTVTNTVMSGSATFRGWPDRLVERTSNPLTLIQIYADLIQPTINTGEEFDGAVIASCSDISGQYRSNLDSPDDSGLDGPAEFLSGLETMALPYGGTQDIRMSTSLADRTRQQNYLANVPEVRVIVTRVFGKSGIRSFRFTPRRVSALETRLIEADGIGNPIEIDGVDQSANKTTTEFVSQFKFSPFFGYTMNPVHALREAITDSEWGAGVDESMIDEPSFSYAARVCFNEKLDYCYVHNQLGGVDKLITQITDYIDGVVYYDAFTNKVKLKLIRQDYDFDSIPSFNEANISTISSFKRQHTNEVTNSVTVRYREAVTDSQETVTIHDQDAASVAGGVVSTTLGFDGCATQRAAVRVAERELAALSKPVINFNANINPQTPLGLGDPIKVSYQDLGISNLVMRVSRIDYTDGIRSGVNVSLIQDVFADARRFGSYLIGSTAPTPDRDAVLYFLEASATDLASAGVSNPFANSTTARYYKIGWKGALSGDANLILNNLRVLPCIGDLLVDLPEIGSGTTISDSSINSTDPISINFPDLTSATASLITSSRVIQLRIGDEVVNVQNGVYDPSTGIFNATVNRRAVNDTVATVHLAGETVYILARMITIPTAWDGFGIPVGSANLVLPNITFVSRANRPYPPAWVTINTKFTPEIQTDGDLNLRIQPRRSATGDTADQKTVYRLLEGETVITSGELDVRPSILGLDPPINTVTIPTATIGTGTKTLTLVVGSRLDTRTSWQSWNFTLDWSATTRERVGWTYNFGNNWGHGPATIDPGLPIGGAGWGEDWDETWDN